MKFRYTTKFSHSLFLPKIQENLMFVKKCTGMNTEKSLSLKVKHFHQNIRTYLDQWLAKYCVLEINLSKERCWLASWEVFANKFCLSQIQLGILALVTMPGKFCNFSLFPTLKLAENCYLNMNISFLEKWQFNHKLGPLSLLQTFCAWKAVLTI